MRFSFDLVGWLEVWFPACMKCFIPGTIDVPSSDRMDC